MESQALNAGLHIYASQTTSDENILVVCVQYK